MTKSQVYKSELEKLKEIFLEVEPSKMKLIEGLIEEAAFLRAENYELKELLRETGMIKVHPQHRDLQKPTEAGKQYLKNINSYAVVIKTLNSVLQKNVLDPEDEFDNFMQGMKEND